ncbi:hypothetical protein [Mycobacterium sp. ZZG]
MKPPDFLMVLPADIGRVGVLGATILALVRYVTTLPGETNGRKMVDGEMWWRASHDDIGQSLGGLHRDSIRRAVLKLQGAGELLARAPVDTFYGDRAQAYRAPDLPLRGMQQGSDLPLRENAESITRNAASSCGETQQAGAAKSPNLPISEELNKEGRENARAAEAEPLDVETVPDTGDEPPPPDFSDEEPQPLDVEEIEPAIRELVAQRIDGTDAIDGEVIDDDSDPEPQPYCDLHMPHGTDNSCGACGRRRKLREKWERRQQASWLKGVFSTTAEPAQPPVRRQPAPEPAPRPEPPEWIPGPDGRPRCRRHGHRKVAPANCTECRDAAIAAGESA